MEFHQELANHLVYEPMVHVVSLVAKEKTREIHFLFLFDDLHFAVDQLDCRIVFSIYAFVAFDP